MLVLPVPCTSDHKTVVATSTIHDTVMANGEFWIFIASTDAYIAQAAIGSSLTLSVVAATGVISRATGSFIADGFRVGQIVTFSGFTNGGNNATKTLLGVTATTLAVATAGLVDETGNGNEAITFAASAADGSMFVKGGVPMLIDGGLGSKLAQIRLSADGIATLTRAKMV